MNNVLIFDLNGNRIGSLRRKPPDALDGPSALALANGKMYVLNMLGIASLSLISKQNSELISCIISYGLAFHSGRTNPADLLNLRRTENHDFSRRGFCCWPCQLSVC